MSVTGGESPVVPRKFSARIAMVGVEDGAAEQLQGCFRHFGISTVVLGEDAPERMRKEKFEALTLKLQPGAERVLDAARNSSSNRRVLVYGVCESPSHAVPYAKFGINALFEEPVRRQVALKVVRATHLLVVNEFRRYVRLPLLTEVELEHAGSKIKGLTSEISAGGMSLSPAEPIALEDWVLASFKLPNEATIKVRAVVCWSRDEGKQIGIRFDPADERRYRVRAWIDDYLGIA